jgi:hypothetical protein
MLLSRRYSDCEIAIGMRGVQSLGAAFCNHRYSTIRRHDIFDNATLGVMDPYLKHYDDTLF